MVLHQKRYQKRGRYYIAAIVILAHAHRLDLLSGLYGMHGLNDELL